MWALFANDIANNNDRKRINKNSVNVSSKIKNNIKKEQEQNWTDIFAT